MKYAWIAVVVGVVVMSAVAAPPPLKVDKSAPLLLDEPKEAKPKSKPEKPLADNQPCYVCHTNYQEEWLAQEHKKQTIGCVDCHGPSLAHRNDENNTTPPDKMYPAEKIETACKECHSTHDAPAKKVVARFQERCPGKELDKVVCTDCHGEHRLKVRTVRWDKHTGKVLLEPATKATGDGKK